MKSALRALLAKHYAMVTQIIQDDLKTRQRLKGSNFSIPALT